MGNHNSSAANRQQQTVAPTVPLAAMPDVPRACEVQQSAAPPAPMVVDVIEASVFVQPPESRVDARRQVRVQDRKAQRKKRQVKSTMILRPRAQVWKTRLRYGGNGSRRFEVRGAS